MKKALDIIIQLVGEKHRFTVESSDRLGNLYYKFGNITKCKEFAQKSIDMILIMSKVPKMKRWMTLATKKGTKQKGAYMSSVNGEYL